MRSLALATLLLPAAAAAEIRELGNLVLDGVPEIPDGLRERMVQYANTREAALADWDPSGKGMLIVTRFGETAQVHGLAAPGADRRQLTFLDEPITAASFDATRPGGFIFRMDVGGGEFHQYYWYDLTSGQKTLLTDGKSRNESLVLARRGGRIAYLSTRRNNKDFDLWMSGLEAGSAPLFVIQGKNDPRVPLGEAQQIVKVARANKLPVWYLLAKDEGHGFKRKFNKDFYLAAVSRFFEEHLVK